MEEIRKTTITLPVKMHQVIIENVCNTGVSIVATKEF
jgi:CxxC motif-containing protein